MIELLESDLGIALLTTFSGLVGAVIAISGNLLIEKVKGKRQLESELREKELNAYGFMLAAITAMVSHKRSLVSIGRNVKVNDNGNSDINDHTKSFIFDLLKKEDEMTLEALPKAAMYADEDIRDGFFELYHQIQCDNELIADLTEEGIKKYIEHFQTYELEEKIRNRIKALKSGERK